MYTDEKQRRLHELYSELRRIKQKYLPRNETMTNSMSKARNEILLRNQIRLIEDEIDRVLREAEHE